MALKDQLNNDIKTALKAGDRDRTSLLRMVTAAIKQREVDERIELDDAAVLGVIEKMVKQRRESEKAYRDGNRADLADKEANEIVVLKDYLPEPLGDAEVDALIESAIEQTGATTMRDMGKVVGMVKAAAQGRVDMAAVSQRIKARLS
ncbi:MAG: GatB/YqeY domain-containing protein [Pseudomonadota bacterium]